MPSRKLSNLLDSNSTWLENLCTTSKNLNGKTGQNFFTREKRNNWLLQNAIHNHRQSWSGNDSTNNLQKSAKKRGKVTSALGNILDQLEYNLGSLAIPDQDKMSSSKHHRNNCASQAELKKIALDKNLLTQKKSGYNPQLEFDMNHKIHRILKARDQRLTKEL